MKNKGQIHSIDELQNLILSNMGYMPQWDYTINLNILDNKYHQENRDYTPEQKANDEKVHGAFKNMEEDRLLQLFIRLSNLNDIINLNDETIKKFRKGEVRKNQLIIDQFIKLYKYVPFDRLQTDLTDIGGHAKKFRGYCNAVVFWALAEDHIFKMDSPISWLI